MKVDKYGRPSKKHPLVSIGRRLRFPLNKFMASQSLIPTDPFLDPASFPELALLTNKWEQIRDEFLAVFEDRADIPSLSTISPDHRRIAPPEKWKSFFFWAHGYVARKNCELCPVTAAAISELPGGSRRVLLDLRTQHTYSSASRRYQGTHKCSFGIGRTPRSSKM